MAVEIDYYITMVSKNNELVNLNGSSLTFSTQGGRGKEKNKPAEKIDRSSEGAAEFPPTPPFRRALASGDRFFRRA